MLGQIPLVLLTEPLEKMRGSGTTIGNCIFWVSFCLVGQPFGALYYFYRFPFLLKMWLIEGGIVCMATDNSCFIYCINIVVAHLILDKYIEKSTLSSLNFLHRFFQSTF
jgi:hypothetical protein